MTHEFNELALDGHNYPTWALDVKISMTFRGIMAALTPPAEREATFLDTYKYQALYIIWNHLHPDLRLEYVMEEEHHSLWVALKGRYEQQKAILLSEANYEWTQIHLHYFKPNCGFLRKNHQKRTRLKRLFRLCSPLIRTYNINTGSGTTNTMLTSFMTYSRLRSMMHLLLRIIINVVLWLLLSLRFTTMRKKQVLLRI
jgi:hypothetical protein